jgi:hypothetical protein
VAITGAALAVTGCSSEQPVTPAPPSAADHALTELAHTLAAPGRRYVTGRQQLFQAELEFTRRCMLDQGLTHPAVRPDQADGDGEWTPDPDRRRSHGYGMDPASHPAPDGWLTELPADRRSEHIRALKGDPQRRATYRLPDGTTFNFGTTGCIAQSRVQLYGNVVDAARVSYVLQDAHQTVQTRVSADMEMRDAVAGWAACMRGRGFTVSTSSEARDVAARAYQDGDLASARRTEIRVATTDAECAIAAKIPQVAERVGRRYADQLPTEQRRELNAVAVLWNDALQRAGG